MLGRGEHLGLGERLRERRFAQRAAALARQRRAGDAVIAVGVIGAESRELKGRRLTTAPVVGDELGRRGVARRRGEPQQGRRRARAVEAAVRDHCAGEGAFRAAVVRVQVDHERRAKSPQWAGEAFE